MKIIHLIIGLNIGGAETMLTRLVSSFSESLDHQHIVVSLTDEGKLGSVMRSKGIEVYSLGLRSAFSVPIVFWRLIRLLRLVRPDILQTWMYHSDLLGGLASRFAGCRVVWNVRSTAIPQGKLSATYWLVRVCAVLSHFIPERIICCADSSKQAHIKLRYAARKMTVIPNGYDFSAFARDLNSISLSRGELGFLNGELVIGVVGRFDPLKDFFNFVTAASYVAGTRDDVRFLMVGRGNDWSNAELRGWIERAGLIGKCTLVGQQEDVARYLSAMDIFCLSSVSEGFPNVVVEAMAMGLPCVVTRAGDAAEILGDDVFVVPPKDPESLAHALLQMCDLGPVERGKLGESNAARVREIYRIEEIGKKYQEVYDEVTAE